MYAVRINPDSACKPKLRAPGEVWVKCRESHWYVQEPERGLFETIQDANLAKCEPWEIVVKVEVEK